jgi:hypothetical protein
MYIITKLHTNQLATPAYTADCFANQTLHNFMLLLTFDSILLCPRLTTSLLTWDAKEEYESLSYTRVNAVRLSCSLFPVLSFFLPFTSYVLIALYLIGLSAWIVGRDSSVGIATRYRLDGPGIESRWGRDFQHPYRPVLGPTQSPIHWVSGLFPGGKAAGAWSWPLTHIYRRG